MSAAEPRAKGDHFSGVAAGYAVFRPRYTPELFDFVASIAPAHRCAWDCGAGTGQATVGLADHFDHVIGTDVSPEQIANAPAHPKIEWHAAPAESVPIASGSVDLITVAQALHWFDHDRFYTEVRRVAVPGAAIAAWTYAAPTMEGTVGEILRRFMFEDVGAYWPPERKYVDDEYRSIPFPFARIPVPPITLENDWTLGQVVGYTRTMSATDRYMKANGTDPVIALERELRAAWGNAAARRIVWPLIMLAGRVS